jgi:hypothetical protein
MFIFFVTSIGWMIFRTGTKVTIGLKMWGLPRFFKSKTKSVKYWNNLPFSISNGAQHSLNLTHCIQCRQNVGPNPSQSVGAFFKMMDPLKSEKLDLVMRRLHAMGAPQARMIAHLHVFPTKRSQWRDGIFMPSHCAFLKPCFWEWSRNT